MQVDHVAQRTIESSCDSWTGLQEGAILGRPRDARQFVGIAEAGPRVDQPGFLGTETARRLWWHADSLLSIAPDAVNCGYRWRENDQVTKRSAGVTVLRTGRLLQAGLTCGFSRGGS